MLTKIKPKRRQKTIAGLVEQAAELLQKIRRIESADETGYCRCVSCGNVRHWKEGDGGHWISRKRTATKLNPKNIHFQCKGCNGPNKQVAGPWYDKYMRDTYGHEFADQLLFESRKEKKYSRPEIMEVIESYKERLRGLE